MANRIRPLRRTGSTGVPDVANMLDGEIAVNSLDKKIYMRVGSSLIEIANASSGDWNTLANKPTNFVYNNAASTIAVRQGFGAVDNSAFGGRFFVAEAEAATAGPPGYGFHKLGAYGWFLYAFVDGFYAIRNDGLSTKLVFDNQNQPARLGQVAARNDNGQGLIAYGSNFPVLRVLRSSDINVSGQRVDVYVESNGSAAAIQSYSDAAGASIPLKINPAGGDTTFGGNAYIQGVRVPKTFVQPSDPGAAAADGDLWIW